MLFFTISFVIDKILGSVWHLCLIIYSIKRWGGGVETQGQSELKPISKTKTQSKIKQINHKTDFYIHCKCKLQWPLGHSGQVAICSHYYPTPELFHYREYNSELFKKTSSYKSPSRWGPLLPVSVSSQKWSDGTLLWLLSSAILLNVVFSCLLLTLSLCVFSDFYLS